MKSHYDPDKFLYDIHSLSLEQDLYILCEMSVYLRFLCAAVFFSFSLWYGDTLCLIFGLTGGYL